MTAHRRRRPGIAEPAIAAALATSLAVVYLRSAAAAAHQHWDSLSYASSVASGRFEIWGNHPLSHALQNLACIAARRLDAGIAAMPILEGLNAAASGVAVAVLFLLAVRGLELRPAAALGNALVLAGSYGFWSFSGTADVYSLAILFGAAAWAALLAEVSTPSGARLVGAAGATALAVCAHQLQFLIAPSAGWLLARTAPKGRVLRRAGTYLAATALFTACGYAALGVLASGSASPSELYAWSRGYVGDVRWGGRFDFASLEETLAVASAALLRPVWVGGLERGVRAVLLGALLLAPALGLARARAGVVGRAVAEAAWLELAGLSVLTVWWEGTNPKLWLLALVPYALAVAVGLRACASGPRARLYESAVLALALAVATFNVGAIAERARPDPRLESALEVWVRHSEPDDVLIPTDELVPHLLFRAGRPGTVNLDAVLLPSREGSLFEPLRARLDGALCAGRQVFVAERAGGWVARRLPERIRVSRESLTAFFSSYGRTRAFDYESPFESGRVEVYRLSPPVCDRNPSAADRAPGSAP